METRAKVAHRIKAWQVIGPALLPIDITLSFDPDEPPVVTLTFEAIRGGEPVVWVVARDLLVGGLDSSVPVGLGDVRMWLVERRSILILRLNIESHEGEATYDLPARQVQRFVHATRRSVPQAAEGAWFNSGMTDIAMARLIDSGPRLSICPVCRGIGCLNADHAEVREGIRVDQWLKMQIEATDD